MKMISFVNPKGGAGKTTSAINIAYALKNKDKKVLLIDTDPRGAVATYLNIHNENTILQLIKEIYDNFGIIENLGKYITTKNGVDVIISDSSMIDFDKIFPEEEHYQDVFRELRQKLQNYDYVIIDTEGTISNTVKSVLNATDYIFAPTKSSYIDMNGIVDLKSIYEIAKLSNPNIKLTKIFTVQAEVNTRIFKKSHNDLKTAFESMKDEFGKNPYSEIYIRKSSDILNSMELNKDIFSYKKTTTAGRDYKNLVYEFLQEEKKID